jgi:hypothetical protein
MGDWKALARCADMCELPVMARLEQVDVFAVMARLMSLVGFDEQAHLACLGVLVNRVRFPFVGGLS